MQSENFLGMKTALWGLAALMFMSAGTNVYDAFSAVMSSPWSTEKFTQSPEEEAQARKYVRHAIIISWIYAGGGAVLAGMAGGLKLAMWPLLGAGIVTVYMTHLYKHAISVSPNGDTMTLGVVSSGLGPHTRNDNPGFIRG